MDKAREAKAAKIARNAAAIISFEDMNLTEQSKEDMRRILRGEVSGGDVIVEIEAQHSLPFIGGAGHQNLCLSTPTKVSVQCVRISFKQQQGASGF